MPRRTRTLLVANPTARTGKARKFIAEAMDAMTASRLDPEFLPTLPNGGTVAALAQRLEHDDVGRVVYLGGDGTFAEAAKGIILARERTGIDVPLGMIPMGTANDQGRSFGIASGPKALLNNIAIIADGIEQWLDVGTVRAIDDDGASIADDLWFDNCGFGMSAQVLAMRNRDRDFVGRIPLLRAIYRDKLVYTGATLKSMLGTVVSPSRFDATIVIDDVEHRFESLSDIVVNGTILYAGDWVFDPTSRPDDGQFELILVRGNADWAAAALSGHKHNPTTADDRAVLGLPERQTPRGRTFDIQLTPSPGMRLHAQIDGEEFPSALHFQVSNLCRHLRILVPENPHWI